jgi:hypothetical protein
MIYLRLDQISFGVIVIIWRIKAAFIFPTINTPLLLLQTLNHSTPHPPARRIIWLKLAAQIVKYKKSRAAA